MTKEKIGGYGNKLMVSMTATGKIYFSNSLYGMECFISPRDIREYIKYPYKNRWGSESHSNSVDEKDRDCIVNYLKRKYLSRYKSVDELMKSKSKYKRKYLMQFAFDELQEYIKKKEDKNVKVKSGC